MPPPNVQSGWYLINSSRPAPPSVLPPALASRAPGALPSLSRYRQSIARRKDHLPPRPARADRALPRPAARPAAI